MTDQTAPSTVSGENDAPPPSAEGETTPSLADYVTTAYEAQLPSDTPPVPDTHLDAPALPEADETAQDAVTGTDGLDAETGLPADHPDAPALPAEETPDPAQAAQETTDADAEEATAELPDEVSDEELAGYKPNAAKRVRKLLAERHDLRREAERYQPFVEVVERENLSHDDIGMALGLTTALQRGDFKTFLEGVMPLVEAAQTYMGQRLTPQLQQQVDQGYITHELALQQAQAAAQAAYHQGQSQKHQQAVTERQQAEQAQAARVVMARAVESWEGQIRTSDPDYARKEPVIRRIAQALVAERGPATTPDQAVQLAQDAYAEANKQLLALAPAPPPRVPTPPVPDASMSARTNGAAPPDSLGAAIRQGLRRAVVS